MRQKLIAATDLFQAYQSIQKQCPIVHSITNFVVMQTTANVLLAIGASPIMAHAIEELYDILTIAQSLVLNLGTIDPEWFALMIQAQQIATTLKKPIILDPVGAGSSKFRTECAQKILSAGVTILRGNASEILALDNQQFNASGIDSHHQSLSAVKSALNLVRQYQCCVVVTGATDIICSIDSIIYLKHGSPLLTRVTGMGCSVTALIAAYSAIETNPLLASAYAIAMFTMAAEKIAKIATGPGSFYIALLDVLSNLSIADFAHFDYEFVPC